ncbi:taurine catabolism dioxygenase [Paramyrothecium foliicola]|nr:taurine catabolism dioxygenase [Paramyrothecium foliicola]
MGIYRTARAAFGIIGPKSFRLNSSRASNSTAHGPRCFATMTPCVVPNIVAPDFSSANAQSHVRQVAEQLQRNGILKVSLEFDDPSSRYLEQLLLSLNRHHGHQLPITHSAERGWFWDVRPATANFQAGSHQARSETMNDFPWHTDCSYEHAPPRYFALQVLQHDRHGGGTLSVMNTQRLSELLSPTARFALMRPDFRIATPPEFIKDPRCQQIVGSLLLDHANDGSAIIRFREDLVTPLNARASQGLDALKQALQDTSVQRDSVLHLRSSALPKGSIILIDNRKWLHARNHVTDPQRHLRRVRWDASPFELRRS